MSLTRPSNSFLFYTNYHRCHRARPRSFPRPYEIVDVINIHTLHGQFGFEELHTLPAPD